MIQHAISITNKYKNSRGMTLIELLVVLAIITLITTQALPFFQRYIYRTHRQSVTADLMNIQQQMVRQYQLNNGQYTLPKDLAEEGSCNFTSRNTSGTPPRYKIAVEIAENSQSYRLTAIPCPNQSKDRCGTLRLDSYGFKSVNYNGSFITDGHCF